MKFKLKQPTKYMHQNLEQHEKSSEEQDNNQEQKDLNEHEHQEEKQKKQFKDIYKHKKIIKKKNQPSALRLERINETFQNIYKYSNKLFEDLNVDHQKLQQISQLKQKNKCKCDKNVKFYCLKCMQKVCKEDFPKIQLPIQISIIHHQSQKINKSSALPLKFLTNQINFHFYSSNQSNQNEKLWTSLPKPSKDTYILFPHKNSKTINQISNPQSIKNLVILDCTWFQTDILISEMQKKGYENYIRIQGYKSIYWRYNHHNDEALCSAEAITYFMRDYQKSRLRNQQKVQQMESINQKMTKKYDNLLFLYCLNLKMIMRQEQSRLKNKKVSQNAK